MKRITAIILAVLLVTYGLGNIAYAADSGQVGAGFATNYSYAVSGNGFTNDGEVLGQKNWHAYLERQDAGTVTGVSLSLFSGLELYQMNPAPDVIAPPDYEWTNLGDIEQGSHLGVDVGPGGPVSFTPGFDASREAGEDHFFGVGTENYQTLNVSIKSRDEDITNFHIDIATWDDENVSAVITDVTNGYSNAVCSFLEEGHVLQIEIQEPGLNNLYTFDVTIMVIPKASEIEFMPQVGMGWGEAVNSGTVLGGGEVTHSITDLGTWTWRAAGDYDWLWSEYLNRSVYFESYSRPNEVRVGFQSVYQYDVPGDTFNTDGLVTGGMHWHTHLQNNLYISEGEVTNTNLSFDTEWTFEHFSRWNLVNEGPPTYEWSYGSLAPGQGADAYLALRAEEYQVDFEPGIHASRTVDNSDFSGPSIQTMEISVTPKANMPVFSVGVNAEEHELVNATIESVASPTGLSQFQISPDGHNLNIWENAPVTGNTYTYIVTISVQPRVPQVTYVPHVEVQRHLNTIDHGMVSGASINQTTDVGDWTWSAGNINNWHKYEDEFYSLAWEPVYSSNVVYTNFVTALSYRVSGDEYYDASPVEGEMSWHSQLYTRNSFIPVPDVTLRLESGRVFDWIDPGADSVGPPVEWSYGTLNPWEMAEANVGHGPSAPFLVGLDATRSVDETVFSGEGTHTQNVNVTVTPQRPMPSLHVRFDSHDDANIHATITGAEAVEADNIWLHPEGLGLEIVFENPVVGETYTCQVTLEVELTDGFGGQEFEFKPHIQITWHQDVATGVSGGSSISYGLPQLGTWNWNIGEGRVWQWNQHIRRNLDLQGYAGPLKNQAVALFQNLWNHLSFDDVFDEAVPVTGVESWVTNILNMPDNTGGAVGNTVLELAPETTFIQVNPEPTSLDPTYRWEYGTVLQNGICGASVSNQGTVNFTTGFIATRSFDQTVFSEPGTQTVTIKVTPHEAMPFSFVEVFAFENPSVRPEIIDWSGADGVFMHPLGRHLLIIKEAPEPDVEFEVTVTCQITPKVAQVEYKPVVRVSNPEILNMEPVTDYPVSYDVVGVGTWTWYGDGVDEWGLLETTTKAVTFPHQSRTLIEEFSIAHMSVDFDDKPNQDKIVAEGAIRLGEATSYDFSLQDVVITIDGLEIIVPAGFLEKKISKECYQFKSAGGAEPEIDLELDFENGEWRLKVNNIDASLIDNSDGVDVVMTIGPPIDVDLLMAMENIAMKLGGLTYIAAQ